MEAKDLPGFVLTIVFVGILIGVGLLIFDSFGNAAYQDVGGSEQISPNVDAGLALAQSNLTQFGQAVNATDGTVVTASNYTVALSNGTFYLLDAAWNNSALNITYTWRNFQTATRTTMTDMANATTPISNTWLTLIVTIVVLSIILTLVIRSFRMGR